MLVLNVPAWKAGSCYLTVTWYIQPINSKPPLFFLILISRRGGNLKRHASEHPYPIAASLCAIRG